MESASYPQYTGSSPTTDSRDRLSISSTFANCRFFSELHDRDIIDMVT